MDRVVRQSVVKKGLSLFLAEIEAVRTLQSQGWCLDLPYITLPLFVAIQGILATQNVSIFLRALLHLPFRERPLTLVLLGHEEGALIDKALRRCRESLLRAVRLGRVVPIK